MKRIAWIGCGALLLTGALWYGLRKPDSSGARHLDPVEGSSAPVLAKARPSAGADNPESAAADRAAVPSQPGPITPAEQLVLEGKASPAMVAAVAKASALVPRFKQVLQLPAEQAEETAARLMDEVSDLPLLTDELTNSMRDVLLTGSPQMIDYATSALEEQGTPASAGLLVDLLRHPNQDVRDSALTAMEGMAGDVFDTPEAAENWARNWKLTPQEQLELTEDVTASIGGTVPDAVEIRDDP